MDKYTKLQKIGQGSFGAAFLCVKKNEPHGRRFVLKEIRMDPRDQPTALREAQLLAALDHPNIIACRESFLASPSVLCIITEFADGGDLRKALTARRTPYGENEALDLILQCCLALKHLHDRKIIHRDIKPENLFLTAQGVVKLGDFGVATVLSHTLACAQTLTGTPYYTSPEICQGHAYTAKTDVWSLGCVLYELATLTHAFTGRSQRQLFENIIAGRYTSVPGRVGALITEMLQLNPRNRPSVSQLLHRPIFHERIQQFLLHRAIADDMSHTVLHGHHILKSPSPVRKPPPNHNPRGRVNLPIRRNSFQSSKKKLLARAKVVSPPPKPTPVKKPVTKPAVVAKGKPVARPVKPSEKDEAKRPSVVAKQIAPVVKPTPSPAQVQPRGKSSPSGSISDRVSAFNAQWQAQRKQILGNLGPPAMPPPPVDNKPTPTVDKPASVVPPPAPIVQPRVNKPTSAAALAAAKQREAMRRDIQAKKKKQSIVASPLDDPVILVQNLPDYKPPPASVAIETKDDDDVPTPDSTVAAQANLEFQRMLLQLQRVVDEPESNDDEENDIVHEALEMTSPPVVPVVVKDHELRETTSFPPPPFDIPEKPTGVTLSRKVLESPQFKTALKAALQGGSNHVEATLSPADATTLAWLHQYIQELL